jgi:hypothetical protein
MTRRKLELADQLAQFDPYAPYASEVWAEAKPVGHEAYAPAGEVETPLGRQRGTCRAQGQVEVQRRQRGRKAL